MKANELYKEIAKRKYSNSRTTENFEVDQLGLMRDGTDQTSWSLLTEIEASTLVGSNHLSNFLCVYFEIINNFNLGSSSDFI